ncbi:hypothetical protein [Halobellus sp. Atlit-38R]|uniref:hypothetical protein n=1 Tax=Halobellus sp. Atlit-38R TaxID=2282131 RepID=UPI001F2345B6|nr:hypothetical protein [Halobellus sp. Atlit-38R]
MRPENPSQSDHDEDAVNDLAETAPGRLGGAIGPRSARIGAFALALVGVLLFARGVAASNAAVGLSEASSEGLSIPRWLYVATGGAAIGASALLAGFVTDRGFVNRVHEWRHELGARGRLRGVGMAVGSLLGALLIALIVYRGITGPQVSTINFAVVVVFAGGRAGLTMAAYAIGNPWPALNPFRAVTSRLPTGVVDYPERLGRWPAVAGILLLIWVETTTGVTNKPSLLAAAVAGYAVVALAGAVLVGSGAWFRNADPVSAFFRFYGRVAPLAWEDGRLRLSLPAMRLVEDWADESRRDGGDGQTVDIDDTRLVRGLDDVAIAVALVWELTFSGFVTTEQGAAVIRAVVGVGLPPILVYAVLFVGGFAVFYGAFLGAARVAVRRILTTRTPRELVVAFAPSLLVIAAGYHLAHYFAFFLSLLPSLSAALADPLSAPANPVVFTLPAWVSALNIVFVLGGHLVAIWVAHSTAYQLFPSRLQAIRSQYPFVFVMIGYTAVSLWLISLPSTTPAFLG